MIIWSGYGILVFIIYIINSLLIALSAEMLTGNPDIYEESLFPIGVSSLISGGCVFLMEKYFDNKRQKNQGTRVFDIVTLKIKSTLFFIEVKYWPYVLGVIGVLLMSIEFFR